MPTGNAPQAGPQKPDKYGGKVGPKYKHYGELEYAGFVYNPATDDYYYDPEAQARWEIEAKKRVEDATGTAPETPPGIWEQAAAGALPVAAIVGGTALTPHLIPATAAEKLAEAVAAEKLAAMTPAVVPAAAAPPAASAGLISAGGAAPVEAANGVFDISGIGSTGNAILPIGGGLIAIDTAMHDRGLASNALRGGAAGAMIGSAFGGVGAIPGYAIGAGLGGLLGLAGGGIFGHKSTKQIQTERESDLLSKGYTGQQAFLDAINKTKASGVDMNQYTDPNAKDSYKLRVASEDVYVNPRDLVGNTAALESVGNDYFGKWNEQQRLEYNKRLLDKGLYANQKGGWVITNPEEAAKIKAEIDATVSDPNAAVITTPAPKPMLDSPPTTTGGLTPAPAPAGGAALPGGGFTRSGSMFRPDVWESAVSSGRFRPGSAGAGGYVDVKTGKWFPYTSPVPG